MDQDDEFDDEFGDIDDAALIAAATQVETKLLHSDSGGIDPASASSYHSQLHQQQYQKQLSQLRWVPNGPLRQTTLTGAPLRENVRPTLSQRVTSSSGSSSKQNTFNNSGRASQVPMAKHNWPLLDAQSEHPPTHHRLDLEAAKLWVYPTNLGHRDYQYNIVQRALFNNLLVALPTGLGKTFIAAVVMLNWYRWAPETQIAFLAPTKPLVLQQVDACCNITGIPRSQVAVLTGQMPPKVRAEYWEERRVFFTTPQTIHNDLKTGIADPKKLICLVIDEAHRATGSYAYVEVVKFIRRFNNSFRILALTATPGSKIETVQEVIDALGIARVEIRTEESLDIRPYVHKKRTEKVVVGLSPEINELKALFSGCVQPLLDDLRSKKCCYQTNADKLNQYSLLMAKNDWQRTPAAQNAPAQLKWQIINNFDLLIALSHPLHLLLFHGIRSFYSSINSLRKEMETSKAKSKAKLVGDPSFKKLMSRAEGFLASPTFTEHPKLDRLIAAVLRHFMDLEENKKEESRVMIFSSFRISAEEIVKTLKIHEPTIRPHIFVGQQDAKGGQAGMNQQQQLEVIRSFRKGTYNTIVATSIGEEGLDIGEVDLIVCYDSGRSPIRLLQRMGRTGRKRTGNVIFLLAEGKEEENFTTAKDNYNQMQNLIAQGDSFTFHQHQSPRILPREIIPEVDKRHITPAVEAPSPARRGKKKMPPKRFFMPNGVHTGFLKASKIGKPLESSSEDEDDADDCESVAPNYPDMSSTLGLLTTQEDKELQRRYVQVRGDEEIVVAMPRMDAFPEFQTTLSSTKFVKHGRVTKSVVEMLNNMREYEHDPGKLAKLQENFREEDLEGNWNPDSSDTEGSSCSPTPQVTARRDICTPTPRLGAQKRRKRTKSPLWSQESLNLQEGQTGVLDLTSSPEVSLDIDSSLSPSSASDIEEDTITARFDLSQIDDEDEGGEEEEEHGEDGEDKEEDDGDYDDDGGGDDDDDDDSLPDVSILLRSPARNNKKHAIPPRKTPARKKRRISDSDDDDDGME